MKQRVNLHTGGQLGEISIKNNVFRDRNNESPLRAGSSENPRALFDKVPNTQTHDPLLGGKAEPSDLEMPLPSYKGYQ